MISKERALEVLHEPGRIVSYNIPENDEESIKFNQENNETLILLENTLRNYNKICNRVLYMAYLLEECSPINNTAAGIIRKVVREVDNVKCDGILDEFKLSIIREKSNRIYKSLKDVSDITNENDLLNYNDKQILYVLCKTHNIRKYDLTAISMNDDGYLTIFYKLYDNEEMYKVKVTDFLSSIEFKEIPCKEILNPVVYNLKHHFNKLTANRIYYVEELNIDDINP